MTDSALNLLVRLKCIRSLKSDLLRPYVRAVAEEIGLTRDYHILHRMTIHYKDPVRQMESEWQVLGAYPRNNSLKDFVNDFSVGGFWVKECEEVA
jgi:hypothetical protein